MKKLVVIILCFQFGFAFSQEVDLQKDAFEAKQFVAVGNEVLTQEGNFPKAEGEYRKAIDKNPIDPIAKYNLGNAYYNSEKFDEATIRYTEAAKVETASKAEKHKAFHNQGNTFMEQKKYKEAVDAYKNALRNNPKDDETRYNLALAKKMLEEEQKKNDQNKDDQNKDQDQDKKEDNQDQKEGDDKEEKKGDDGDKKEDKNEGDKKDQGDQGDDKEEEKEGDKEKDEKGEPKDDKKDQGQDEKDDQGKPKDQQGQQPQRAQGQLSPQQVKSLLEAMNNEEKKVQDKINAKKVQGQKIKTDKDW